MEVHDLAGWLNNKRQTTRETCLVPALIAHENNERTVIFLNIIVDEDRNPRIQLFAHILKSKKKVTCHTTTFKSQILYQS